MPDGTLAASSPAHPGGLTPMGILRFIATDRVGVMLFVWGLIAFVLRPLLIAAHEGAPVAFLGGLASDPVGLSRIVGMVQVLSMLLPVAIGAMVHIRLGSHAKGAASAFAIPAAYALAFVASYLAFVWTPTTYLSLITRDSFIFFDANYRISAGERPHVDFPTALGAASLYLPWLGSVLAGGNAGSVELASAMLALPLGLIVAHAGMRRFPTGVTAALVALVFFATVPAVLLGLTQTDSHTFVEGQPVVLSDNSTWAMFYNRWGWAALIAIFCYLAPRHAPEGPIARDRDRMIEALVLSVLLAFMFYLKVTYFLVGAAAAVIYVFQDAKPWRTLAIGAGATLGLVLTVGLASGLLIPYLNDLAFVARINAGKSDTLLTILSYNVPAILLSLAPLGILAAIGKFTGRDALIGGFLVLASIFLEVQNAQLFDILSLASLAAYGVARVVTPDRDLADSRLARLAAMGAFALTLATPMIDRTFGLIQQTTGARREEIRPLAAWSDIPALKNVLIAEREDMFTGLASARSEHELMDAWNLANRMKRKDINRQGEYMASLLAGVADLKPVLKPGDSVVAVEMANPFPFMLGARPAKASYLTLDGERTFSLDVYPAAEQMFADADHVMIPRLASRTVDIAHRLYDTWLTANYAERVESLYWVRWSHRRGPANPPTH